QGRRPRLRIAARVAGHRSAKGSSSVPNAARRGARPDVRAAARHFRRTRSSAGSAERKRPEDTPCQAPPCVAASFGLYLSDMARVEHLPLDSTRRLVQGRGRHRVLAALGEGGMARVFLAVARGPSGFNKLCVLKALRPALAEDPDFLKMFLNEARLAARLNHP